MTGSDENRDAGFTPIKPAVIDLTAASGPQEQETGDIRPGGQPVLWYGIGAALLLGVIVFFLLPRWVPEPAVEPHQTSAEQTGTAAGPDSAPQRPGVTSGTADTPWEKAQQSAIRRESQEILGQLLEAQQILEERGVETWAGKEYLAAIEHARSGDTEYGRQNFTGAHEHYARALEILTGLLDGVEALFAETMEAGNTALEEGDSARAREAFTIALAIDPIDRAALQGMERAGLLDDVMELVDKGDARLRDGKFEEARTIYRQALDLDGNSKRAEQQLRVADDKIRASEFNRAMSSGFGSLEMKRYEQAQDSFNRALKLKPGSRDARSGLEQARHLVKSTRINTLLGQAGAAEQREDWQEAVSRYDDVLSLDGNLGKAIEGKKRAGLRKDIHDRLEQVLAQPARLFDRTVNKEIAAFRDRIALLSDPGPVLTGQLGRLARLLVIADTPLQVQFRSDNLTQVTLYKVAELGYFTSRELLLRPGHYVAVGHREGYRDVRVEFFVDPNGAMEPVVVRSDEKIALGQ